MNILLVDTNVKDYQVFVDSVNENTTAIVYSKDTTPEDLLTLLPPTIDRIGFVFTASPTTIFLGKPFTDQDEFLNGLIESRQVKHMDFLGCNTLPLWSDFYAKLNTTVGASNNTTGNLKYGGDWIMESTSEDVEKIYFTNNIEYYKYLLDAAFVNHIVVVKDGIALGCGDNHFYPLGGVSSPLNSFHEISSSIKSVSCGNYHTCAISTLNELWACGLNTSGQIGLGNTTSTCVLTRVMSNISSVSCGENYTCAISTNDELWFSGDNSNGQFGNTTTSSSLTFIKVTTSFTPKSVSCCKQTAVISTLNELWMAGYNGENQLGNGNTSNSSTFTKVSGFSNVTSVSCGQHHTCAVVNNELWVCGVNPFGEFGNNTTTSSSTFIKVTGLSFTPKSVTCGYFYTCVISTANELWVTGTNSAGQIGAGSTSNLKIFTKMMSNISSVICSTGGNNFTLAITTSNELWYTGVIGQSNPILKLSSSDTTTFTKYTEVTNVTNASISGHIGIITSDNKLLTMGYNVYGQTGYSYLKFFQLIPDNVKSVSTGNYCSAIVSTDNKLWFSGVTRFSASSSPFLTKFTNIMSNVDSVSYGYYAGAVITTANELWMIGDTPSGSLTTLTKIPTSFTPKSVSSNAHLCVISTLNELWVYGNNSVGQLGINTGGAKVTTLTKVASNIKSVSGANYNHTFAISTTDQLLCCGSNNFGQFGNTTTTPSSTFISITTSFTPKSVSCGHDYTCVISTLNELWVAGLNSSGQLGVGHKNVVTTFTKVSGLSNVTSVTCGSSNLYVIADNILYSSGANSLGKLGNGTDTGSTTFTPCVIIPPLYNIKKSSLYGGINLNIGSGLISGDSLSLGNALTPAYTYPVPNNTQIGWIIKPTLSWAQGADSLLLTKILPAGVYIFNISVSTSGTFINNFIYPTNSTNIGNTSPNELFFRVPFANSGISGINVACGTYAFTIAPNFPYTTGTISWYNSVSNTQTLNNYDTTIIRVA